MGKVTIFIDNGVTGTIGIIDDRDEPSMFITPVVKMQDYTKKKNVVSRIDIPALRDILIGFGYPKDTNTMAFVERPMINPQRWKSSMSAIRAHEAELSVLEMLEIPYQFVDSKEWQRNLLPSSGKKGVDSSTLKAESRDIGIRLFPYHRDMISRHGDADGLLGAYIMRKTQ